MSQSAISARGVGKLYRIGGKRTYGTLRDSIMQLLARSGERNARSSSTPLWALRDVSFDVRQGEVIGIIGRNGAGKSTLLKILSRITGLSEGSIELRGRVGSLLEVGTGFHPELSGRENIFLSGSIIGMSRREILARFDDIVAFAEVERFLDTPVKHYSSGMYMRLAFAVAAHLETEILLVDEVLAVGDAHFQRKCLGRISDVANSGRTVVFVSHSMGAVRNLCERVIWLQAGAIRELGTAHDILPRYLADETQQDLASAIRAVNTRHDDPVFTWESIIVSQDDQPTHVAMNGGPVRCRMRFRIRQAVRGVRLYVDLCDENQDILQRSFHDEREDASSVLDPGTYEAEAELPADLLSDRPYWLVFQATIHDVRRLSDPIATRLDMLRSSTINRAYPHEPIRGKLLPQMRWRLAKAGEP